MRSSFHPRNSCTKAQAFTSVSCEAYTSYYTALVSEDLTMMDTTPSMDKLKTVNKLRSLCTKLEAESTEMKEAIEELEQGRRERDEARKKLLLAEIKVVIATLHETDKSLIKDVKSEVFDKLRDISKVDKEAKTIISILKTTDEKDMDMVKGGVEELMRKVESLQLIQFNR